MLVYASSIRATAAKEYQHQSKQVHFVGCHRKQTTSMAEVYLNDAVVFQHTFKRTLQLVLQPMYKQRLIVY